jgi:hypothetical protein
MLKMYASYELERVHVTQLGPWELDHLGPLPPLPDNTVIDTYTIDNSISPLLYLSNFLQLYLRLFLLFVSYRIYPGVE